MPTHHFVMLGMGEAPADLLRVVKTGRLLVSGHPEESGDEYLGFAHIIGTINGMVDQGKCNQPEERWSQLYGHSHGRAMET